MAAFLTTPYVVVMDLPVIDKNENYSVACNKWLVEESHNTFLHFPPSSKIQNYLKHQRYVDLKWGRIEVKVLAYCESLDAANVKLRTIVECMSSMTDEVTNDLPRVRRTKGKTRQFEDFNRGGTDDESSSGEELPEAHSPPRNRKVVAENITAVSAWENVQQYSQINEVQIMDEINHLQIERELDEDAIFHNGGNANDNISETAANSENNERDMLAEILRRVISVEEKLTQKLNCHGTILSNICTSLKVNGGPSGKNVVLPKMPIGSLEEFEAIENQLKNDELKDSLVHELRRHFVSNSERDTIFQIMPEVFGIEFATTCSYKGQKDNFKVDGTAVLSTIKESVQSNFEDLRNEVFKSAVSDWFRGAGLRLKRNLKKNVT